MDAGHEYETLTPLNVCPRGTRCLTGSEYNRSPMIPIVHVFRHGRAGVECRPRVAASEHVKVANATGVNVIGRGRWWSSGHRGICPACGRQGPALPVEPSIVRGLHLDSVKASTLAHWMTVTCRSDASSPVAIVEHAAASQSRLMRYIRVVGPRTPDGVWTFATLIRPR
jgi:hypothetical protein